LGIIYTEETPNALDLFTLYETEHWNDFLQLTKESLHQAVSNSWYVICAYEQSKLVGTGRLISDGITVALVSGLIVDPDYRRRGIGKNMINKMVSKCRQCKLTIQLFTVDENMEYYKNLGFRTFANGLIYHN
jgi:N-acetylglutamate synthase-like GNAT family acetyltransferase